MTLVEEIRDCFAYLSNSMVPLQNLPQQFPGYALRDTAGYGVAIELPDDKIKISEHSASARYHTCQFTTNFGIKHFIVLQCYKEDLRMEFATLCEQFLNPGDNGELRKALLSEPLEWWNRWKELLGNKVHESSVSSIISEMVALSYVYKNDKTADWSANGSSTHDIECSASSIEVKSTVSKTSARMTASSQFQLNATKPLYIYFVRLEPSTNNLSGYSINDLVDILVSFGYDKSKLEQMLYKRGFEEGASARTHKYDILETRKYDVDANFPRITPNSFNGNSFPTGIVHLEYTIDLDALTYGKW